MVVTDSVVTVDNPDAIRGKKVCTACLSNDSQPSNQPDVTERVGI